MKTATRNTLAMTLVGSAIGAALGLLFAPKRGSETRANIRRKSRQAKGRLEETLHRLRHKTEEGIEAIKGKASRVGRELASSEAEEPYLRSLEE